MFTIELTEHLATNEPIKKTYYVKRILSIQLDKSYSYLNIIDDDGEIQTEILLPKTIIKIKHDGNT